jgi:hypothetical protein
MVGGLVREVGPAGTPPPDLLLFPAGEALTMSRTLLLLAFLWPGSTLFAGPPEGTSGRIVPDPIPELRAEVQRREREVAKAPSDPSKAEELCEARALLAEAEGRTGAAAAQWRKVIAYRQEQERKLKEDSRRICTPPQPAILQGPVSEARCRLAEVERDRAALAAELPKVIASYQAQLDRFQRLRECGAVAAEPTTEERDTRRRLREARVRLDALRLRSRPAPSPD